MSTQKSKWVFGQRLTSASSGERPAVGYRPDRSLTPSQLHSELQHAGFSGTCENTSLSDWIQLVQMGRRDAIVTIRAHDGRMGRLWCRDGDIIDASCDGLVGENAVYQALSWQGGKVSVDFSPFERLRQIPVATAALLLEAAYRKDSGVRELGYVQGPPSSLPSPATLDVVVGSNARLPSATDQEQRGRKLSVVLGAAAGFLGLALLLAFGISRWSSSPHENTAAASVPEFLVRIEVEPAESVISLDGEAIGVGQVKKMIPEDGLTHEIRCSAPGYVSERLVFRDTPFEKRVSLARSGERLSTEKLAAAPVEPAPKPAPPRSVRAYSPPVRPAAALVPIKAAKVAATHSAAVEKPRELARPVDVQIIEDRRPRIQVIDEEKPRIEAVE